jgi:hypothetical protein
MALSRCGVGEPILIDFSAFIGITRQKILIHVLTKQFDKRIRFEILKDIPLFVV